jgi:small subunit ribosomal protein S18
MKKKSKRNLKKNQQRGLNKLNLFQVSKFQSKKKCPLSEKDAPKIDYKNVKLLKRYMSENGKILPSRITSVSQNKQRKLSLSIKRARILALV